MESPKVFISLTDEKSQLTIDGHIDLLNHFLRVFNLYKESYCSYEKLENEKINIKKELQHEL